MSKTVKLVVLTLLFLVLIITKCGKKSTPPVPPEFEVADNLRLLADSTLEKVSHYEEGVLVFSEPSQQAASLSKGDLIVGGISDATPEGFLRKITYISLNKDTVQTSQATLEDAIKRGHFKFKKTLDPSEASSFKLRKGVSVDEAGDLRFNLKIDEILYDADGNEDTKSDQVVLSGYIYFNSDLELEIDIDWGIKKLIFKNTVDEKVKLDLDIKTTVVNFHEEVKIADYSFPSFVAAVLPTLIGPIPVTATPNLEVNVGLDGKLKVKTWVDVTQEAQFVAGLSYENRRWRVIKDFSNDFEFDTPSLSSSLDIKAFAGPQLNLLLYGCAGPSAEINGYAELEADIGRNPWWTLVAGLEALLGVRAKIFGYSLADYHKKVIDFEKTLAEAPQGQSFGTFTDPRDAQTYRIVKIGDQWWMAENLKYVTESGSWCYDNDCDAHVDIYGRLYDWKTACKSCPPGWHLPSADECVALINFLGGGEVAGGKLKATGTIEDGNGLWYAPNSGATNESGFSGLPAGCFPCIYGPLDARWLGYEAHYWTLNAIYTLGRINASTLSLYHDKGSCYFYTGIVRYGDRGMPVRCVKDSQTDRVPPSPVDDLEVVSIETNSVTLTWTAPGDDGYRGSASEYDLRFTDSLEALWFYFAAHAHGEPTPSPAGGTEVFAVTGLKPNTKYHFALRTRDESSNWSGLSNPVEASTSSDDIAPAAVSDLAVIDASSSAVTLAWTAPGDDGNNGRASVYDIRYSTSLITASNWASANQVNGEPIPQAAGNSESFVIGDLSPSTKYYFAMKTGDEVPNWSGLSNIATESTEEPDITPPAAVTDLGVNTYNFTYMFLKFKWTAPGDDGILGTATQYDFRYSTSPIDSSNWASANQVSGEPTPQPAGSTESFVWYFPSLNITYYVAIKTADEVPNWSDLSNIAIGWTGDPDTTAPAAVTDLKVVTWNPTQGFLVFEWTAPGDNGVYGTATQYDFRYSTSPITSSNWISANEVSGEPTPQHADSTERFVWYYPNPNTTYYVALKTADEVPNWSNLSNVIEVKTGPGEDTTPPAAVTDLRVVTWNPTQGFLKFEWTAPGDNGSMGTATQYDIRYSTSYITSYNWASANQVSGEPTPQRAGSTESYLFYYPNPNTTYYVALKTADEVPNWSDLSNVVEVSTGPGEDTTPPAAISDLSAGSPSASSITLEWTAPGDDGNSGTASEYDIRFSTSTITSSNWSSAARCSGEPTPKTAGGSESFTVTGLSSNTTYYFAIKTGDEVPNWSGLSNVPSAKTLAASEGWSSLGSGMNDNVYTVTVFNGKLIAAGAFTKAGGVSANRIAAWNGSSWSPLGSGLNDDVWALAVYNGQLVAAGEFTSAGGVSANHIAAWNGSSWSSLGLGTNDRIFALTTYSNRLVAGGWFTSAGGISANHIAAWNGSSWSALGSGTTETAIGALGVYDGQLIAGGGFTAIGGVSANGIAAWNGSSWSALGSGVGGGVSPGPVVQSLRVYDNMLVAGGNFSTAGGVSANGIATWNGSSWSALGSGVELLGGANGWVAALSVYNGRLMAGGGFFEAGDVSAYYIAAWNGTSWSPLGSGMDADVGALTVYNGRLIAGGWFPRAGGILVNRIAAWSE